MQPRREVSSQSRVLNSELRKIPVAATQQKIPSNWSTATRHKQRLWEVRPDKEDALVAAVMRVSACCRQESISETSTWQKPYQEQIQCISCS